MKPAGEKGFTLVEMAVVLTVIGLVMMTILPALRIAQSANQLSLTDSNLRTLMTATNAYVQANGCLPCPTPASVAGTSFGVVGTGGPTCGTCQATEGIAPFVSLGLPAATARDGWNHWITMRVDPALTSLPANKSGCAVAGNCSVFVPPTAACIDADITNGFCTSAQKGTSAKGFCRASTSTSDRIIVSQPGGAGQEAAVLFISHGKDGYGSYFAQPISNGSNGDRLPFNGRYAACTATGGYAQCNADGDRFFVDAPHVDNDTDTYDDRLIYASRNQIAAAFGNGACQTGGDMNKISPQALDNTAKLKLGEILLRDGEITRDQIKIALHEQKLHPVRLGTALVKLGFVNDCRMAQAIAEQSGLPYIDLTKTRTDKTLIRTIPGPISERCVMVAIGQEGDAILLAMADPNDIAATDQARRHFPHGTTIRPVVAAPSQIIDLLDTAGTDDGTFDSLLNDISALSGLASLREEQDKHPVVALTDTILSNAVREGASDIHLEPESGCVRLRIRIDGVLRMVREIHRDYWPELSSRLKLMAGMNIADSRSLQDGRFTKSFGGTEIDFRMAVMPTVQGENIVIRILDHRRALLPLDSLGYSPAVLDQIDLMLERPEGIVLVTGPTGCGKTTSLYAMLRKLSGMDVNIMTLEDPVEYSFDLIRQTAVQEQQGLGFADGVRGLLRQAPDIIFIGEIRDDDTARMALRAAMTGHQVFSTLHCNDAFGALPRLADFGLSGRMMAENISGIVAQRLTRKLCPHCLHKRRATAAEMRFLSHAQEKAEPSFAGFAEAQAPIETVTTIASAKGCPKCGGTGYKGRTAVTEALRLTPELEELIANDAPRSILRRAASKAGYTSMAEDGLRKVASFETSLDELRRNVDLTRLSD